MKIRELRIKLNLTQRHCAKECDVSLTAWQNWEAEVSKPTQQNLDKIKKVLEVV